MPESETNHARDQVALLTDYMNSQALGQNKLVSRMLIALLADGHLLVEGAPGLAKTRAVKTLAKGLKATSSVFSLPRTYCRLT
jgi:MoxR-like ATPase